MYRLIFVIFFYRSVYSESVVFQGRFTSCCDQKEFQKFNKCASHQDLCRQDTLFEEDEAKIDEDKLLITSKNVLYDFDEICLTGYFDEKLQLCVRIKRSGVRKCCRKDEIIVSKSCHQVNKTLSTIFLSQLKTKSESEQYFHEELNCTENFERVKVDDFSFAKNGSIFWEHGGYYIDSSFYCVDLFTVDGTSFALKSLVCVPEEIAYTDNSSIWGMIISMPFLLATFLVYLILPERNLHRKALMSYVFTLLAAYITLVTIQMYPYQFKPVPCQILGYCIIFFFLVSFFWMNVMCIDMWLAFSGMRTVMSKKYAERKRFIIYCIYAWGTPIIHVGIVLLLNTHSPPDADYYPKIGDPRCFLGDGMPTFYYFYLPMAIIIGINIVFFILTTVRIQQIKKETSMLKQTESKKSYEDDKQKFNLYLKLMFAMGINWIMELISWTVEKLLRDTPTFIWYLSDFTNAMYGVLIFVIFVFKKKIWQSLKKRYYVFIGKPHLAHSFTTSSARGTRASNYSTTDTAVSTDYRLNDMKRIPEESALNRT